MIDIDKYAASITYGKHLMAVLAGQSVTPSGYANTDQGVLQWLLEHMDIDQLYNDPLSLELQLTLNRWIIDNKPADETRTQIISILADNFAPHD